MTTTIYGESDPTGLSGFTITQESNATYAVAFTVAETGTLKRIGFYSPTGATTLLPTKVGLFELDNTTPVINDDATWSGAHATGWIWSPVADTELTTGIVYLAAIFTDQAFDQAFIYPDVTLVPKTSDDGNITGLASDADMDVTHPYNNGGADLTYPSTAPPGLLNWLVDVDIDFSAGGGGTDPVFTVTEVATTAGITSYSVDATINSTGDSGPQIMRVLTPDSPAGGRDHGILWMLPVEPGQGTTFGDPLDHAKTLGIHNEYNLTCVQPGFPIDPWYGDHATDPQTMQETFMLSLVGWVNGNIAPEGDEKHYLIGFSKSGFGGQVLFMRNQDVFEKVASWDAATDYQTLSEYDGDAVFGTQGQLDLYKLFDPNLSGWVNGGNLSTVERIWLGAGIDLITATSDYSDRLTADGALHEYVFAETAAHNWSTTPDWVGPAVDAMLSVQTEEGTGSSAHSLGESVAGRKVAIAAPSSAHSLGANITGGPEGEVTPIPSAEVSVTLENGGLVKLRAIRICQNNDTQLTFRFTNPDTSYVVDLTNLEVEFWRKLGRRSSDSDTGSKSYSATISDPTTGVAVVNIPASDNTTPGVIWYRVDILNSQQRETIQFGNLYLDSV
jgi:hypothetical protein